MSSPMSNKDTKVPRASQRFINKKPDSSNKDIAMAEMRAIQTANLIRNMSSIGEMIPQLILVAQNIRGTMG